MSSARRAALVPLAVAAAGVLLSSAPAYASVTATWNKPTDNATFTTAAPIDFSVSLSRSGIYPTTDPAAVYLNLAVPGPYPGPFRVDTSNSATDKDLAFTFTPSCPNYAGACSTGAVPAYNGRYTATISGATTGSRTVVLQVPPAAPAGVSASAAGTHRVRVSWSANREPDLTGYDVFRADGLTVASNLPVTQTSYEFELPSSGYGGDHSYMVRANRLACANCPGPDAGAQVASPMSAPATVHFDEPGYTDPGTDPGADPTADPSTGTGGGYGNGSGSGNGKGNGNGKGTGSGPTPEPEPTYNSGGNTGGAFSSGEDPQVLAQKQRDAFGLTFKSFAPKLGAPKLPPLPQFAPPSDEIPWGTYDPTLDYGTQTIQEKASGSGGITTTLVDSFSEVFQGRKLYRSIAIALLLLLMAGHLRLWLRTTPPTT